MTYTLQEFEHLEKEYGEYSTWAIWQHSKGQAKEKSVNCIKENLILLNSRYVLIGLNISKKIEIAWGNFHGGKHDRKLKYALNDSTFKGSYMTDLFKIDEPNSNNIIVNPNSSKFYHSIKENSKLINKNVELFRQEMKDIKISSDTKFVLFGMENSYTIKLYNEYFKKHFPETEVIHHRHYSSIGTDKAWVESFWNKLEIQADFYQIKEKYK